MWIPEYSERTGELESRECLSSGAGRLVMYSKPTRDSQFKSPQTMIQAGRETALCLTTLKSTRRLGLFSIIGEI